MAGSSEKEDYYIRKFDGTNFTIWRQRMMDVLVNKGLAMPLKNRKEAWDGKSASNKVFLMKKFMRLSMKEGSSVSSHLNEFNALYSQLTSKGLNFDDEMKAIFLVCSLPASWDTFNTSISNSTHGGKLAFGDVTSALLTEDIRRLDYVLVTDCDDPSCYKEAIQMDDSVKWEKAMQSEYNSIIANETWKLTELPQGKQALPCKWVYKKKYTNEDPEPKYKARLVAKGFKQKKGVDFDEIFSPVVKLTTLHLAPCLVATEDLELNQMDVKMAFLHGDLEEDVYMVQPKGFEMESKKPKRAKLVCRLCKALYGLKQGSRQWYLKFDKYMQSQGYERSQEDHCLYTQKLSDGSLIILILYVDDMLIAGKSKDEIANLKKSLSTQFAMKDLGDANHFLGMRIKRDR
ncbi:hypothetical protein L7F22_057091 [Adiantum nelumboides]|nr:hypothetical protein [Adiantum nelumboides]